MPDRQPVFDNWGNNIGEFIPNGSGLEGLLLLPAYILVWLILFLPGFLIVHLIRGIVELVRGFPDFVIRCIYLARQFFIVVMAFFRLLFRLPIVTIEAVQEGKRLKAVLLSILFLAMMVFLVAVLRLIVVIADGGISFNFIQVNGTSPITISYQPVQPTTVPVVVKSQVVLPEPTAATEANCPGTPARRLAVGMTARVTFTDGTPNILRSGPGKTFGRIASMLEGTQMTVIGGPTCASGYWYWQVQTSRFGTGWTAEGDSFSYWLEPVR